MVLIVPKIYQKDENACLPVCIKMVLDYYIQTGKVTNIEEQTVDNIRKKAKVNKVGKNYSMMNISNCNTLNDSLSKSGLSFNFLGIQKIQDVIRLLNEDKPPILVYNAWMYLNQLGYLKDLQDHKHALVVRDLNIEKNEILVNDPDKTLDSLNPFNLSGLLESWRYEGSILLWMNYPQTKTLKEWIGRKNEGK